MANVINPATKASSSGATFNPALILEEGLQFHRVGDYASAMQIYHDILSLEPNYADALHLLGEASYRQGRLMQGLAYLNQAIAISQHHFYLNTRSMVLLDMGKLMEAEQDLRRVIKVDPQYFEAYVNLSNIYRKKRDFKNAKKTNALALQLNPTSAAVWNTIGATHMEAGELDAAVEAFGKALDFAPDALMATKNIAMIYVAQQKWPEALPLLQSAAALQDFEVLTTLSRAHIVLGQSELAIDPFKEAMQLGDTDRRKRFFTTTESLEQLLAVCDALSVYRSNYSDAADLYQYAIEAQPEHPTLINNLSVMQFNQAIYGKAIENLRRLLALEPNNFMARANLGANLSIQGFSEEAIVEYSAMLEYEPNHVTAMGLLLSEKNKICSWDNLDSLRQKMAALLDSPDNMQSVNSFTLLSNYDDPEKLLRWTRINAEENFKNLGVKHPPASGLGRQRKRIRVGYFSFDFRNHPVAHLTAPLFELHDKSKFEVWVYSYGIDDGHPVRQRIQHSAEHFVDLWGCSLQGMVERIRADEIDILIDLSGNTHGAKIQVMGHRPAPVQVHWLGFIGSMGSKHYDYTIVDHFVAPEGADMHFDEKLVRMPNCFQINDTTRPLITKKLTRAVCGLPESGFIFADFSQSYKIQPDIFAAWTQIVKAVPKSILWLTDGHTAYVKNIRVAWKAAGLENERLIFAPRSDVADYLAQYQLVDLFLDVFPYTSGTTASDALWSGCPLLALVGHTMVARMAGSLLKAAELSELITYSLDEYIECAIYYAQHEDELATLRERLIENRLKLPLFDIPKFVKHLENAFEQMALKSWAGKELDAINIQIK